MASKAYKLKLFFPKESRGLKEQAWDNHKEVNQLAREYELLLLLFRGESFRTNPHPVHTVHLGKKELDAAKDDHPFAKNPLAYDLHAATGVASSLNRDLMECIKDLKPQMQDELGKNIDKIPTDDDNDSNKKYIYCYDAEDMKQAGLRFVRLNQRRIANLNLSNYLTQTKANEAEMAKAKEAQERMLEGDIGSDEEVLALIKSYHDYILPEAKIDPETGNIDPNAKGKNANSFGAEPSFMYNFASEAGTKSYIGDETFAILERINHAILKHRVETLDAEGNSLKPNKVYTMPAEGLEVCGSIINQGEFHLGIASLLERRTGNTPKWLKDPYFTNWNDTYSRERLMPQTYAQLEWVSVLYDAQKKAHTEKQELDRGKMQELGIVPCITNTAGATTMKMALTVAIEHMKAWTSWVTKAAKAVEGSGKKVNAGTSFIEKQADGTKALADIDAYEKWYTKNQGGASGNEAKEQFTVYTGTIKQWQLVVEALYGVEVDRVRGNNTWDTETIEAKRESAIKLVQQKNTNFGDFPFFKFVAKAGNEYLWQQEEFMPSVRQGDRPKGFLWRKINNDTDSLAQPDNENQVPLFVLVATLGMWKKEQARIRDFAIYTPPHHIFHPQWMRYESSGTNYDNYVLLGGLKGKGLYELSLGNMGKPPKKRRAKKGEELPPDVGNTYPKIYAVRTNHFDAYSSSTAGKKGVVEFFSNYKQFSGTLGGGKILYNRNMLARLEIARIRDEASGKPPKSTPDSILGGASFISMTVDVEPILANGIDKEIVRKHGTKNETVTKALQVGDNILSIDLGVRTFASCSVFEVISQDSVASQGDALCFPIHDRSKDNLYAVHRRSFPLNMPGEGSDMVGTGNKNAKRAEGIREGKHKVLGLFKSHINFVKAVNPDTDRKEGQRDMLPDMSADNFGRKSKGANAIRKLDDPTLTRHLDNYLDTCQRVSNEVLGSIAANIAANPSLAGTTKEAKQLAARNMALLPEGSGIRKKGFIELKDNFSRLLHTWYRIQKQSKGNRDNKDRRVVWGKTAAAIEYYDRVYQIMKSWQNMGKTDHKFGYETVERTGRFLRTFKDHILNLRNDRVKVGSDLIIRAALGYRPAKISERRIDTLDGHTPKSGTKVGWELVDGAKACKLILFEDLATYRTSFASDRRGNRTLMTWSHRAITETVEKAADAYNMRVITVNADYTSQFYAENGAPGVRGYAIGRYGGTDKNGNRRAVSTVPDYILAGITTESGDNSHISEMNELARMGAYENRITGFAIKKGGPDFLSVALDDDGNKVLRVTNADVNAATNLQTRYLRWDKSWNKMLVKSTSDSKYCDPVIKDGSNMFMLSYHKHLEERYGKGYKFDRFDNSDIMYRITRADTATQEYLGDEERAGEIMVVGEIKESSTKNTSVVAKGTFNLFRDPSGILIDSNKYCSAQKGVFWRVVQGRLTKLASSFADNKRNTTGITLYDLAPMERSAKKERKEAEKLK